MPYRFLEHIATADVAFEAWGATQEELFISSASALLATMVHDPNLVRPLTTLTVQSANEELDLLLFAFLSELVFYKDARKLLLQAGSVEITQQGGMFHLQAVLHGEEIASERHQTLVDVKAITLHQLQVRWDGDMWKATVVVDI